MTALVLITTLAVGSCFTTGLPPERWDGPEMIYRIEEFGRERVRVTTYHPERQGWNLTPWDVSKRWTVQPVRCPR